MSDEVDALSNTFQKRDIIDLLGIIPECKNFKMIKSINDVFVILDERISRILNSMIEMLANDSKNNQRVVPSVKSLEKITADCSKIRALIELQQMKCQIIKDKTGPPELSKAETMREQYILRKLCLKKTIPRSQSLTNGTLFLANTKKRCLISQKRPKTYDVRIEGVRKSVYRAVLLFPASTFRVSEFLKTNPGLQSMMKTVLQVLEREDLITIFPSAAELRNDHLIVKDARPNVTQKTLKMFGLTKDEYFTCNRSTAANKIAA